MKGIHVISMEEDQLGSDIADVFGKTPEHWRRKKRITDSWEQALKAPENSSGHHSANICQRSAPSDADAIPAYEA